MAEIQFNAYVKLGAGLEPVNVPFTVESEGDETKLTWDDVADAAYDAVDAKYSRDDFPNMENVRITIIKEGTEYPVCAESEFDKDAFAGEKQVLVLPECTWSLTPEFKKFIELSERGLIDFEFDAEKMKELMEIVGK